MKRICLSIMVGCVLEVCLQGQTAAQSVSANSSVGASTSITASPAASPSTGGNTTAAEGEPAIIGRTPTSRTWAWIASRTNAGQVTLVTNSYVEVASGLCYSNAAGQLVDAVEQMDIVADGASASHAAHHVHFMGNINAAGGAVHLVAPDGQVFDSRVYGLAYFDTASGSNVLVAPLHDAAGVAVGNNIILYTNAFDGVRADVEYVVKKSGLEQNIILREQPPSPASIPGFNPQTTRLQVLSEFLQSPEPEIKRRVVNGIQEDVVLKFGVMSIGPGKAFYTQADGQGPVALQSSRVAKEWLQVSGRRFLREEVPWPAISNAVQNLPLHASAAPAGTAIEHLAALEPLLPGDAAGTLESGPMNMAQAMPKEAGLVIDYSIVSGSSTGIEFYGGTTYLVSGCLYVDPPGTVVFDGGTIVKIQNSADATIFNNGSSTAVFNTSAYQYAQLTSADDNSIGQAIYGSSGNPTTGGYPYLAEYGGSGGSSHVTVSNVSFAYAGIGYYDESDVGHLFQNCEFKKCGTDMMLSDSAFSCQNILSSQCRAFIADDTTCSMSADNVTVDGCSAFTGPAYGYWGPYSGAIVNSILNNCDGSLYDFSLPYTAVTSGLSWQTGFLGDHYLPPNSPYLHAGNTTADQVGLYWFTTQTSQVPQGASQVDRGYHYRATDSNGNPINDNGAGGNWSTPSIITQPASQSVAQGSNATFSVAATGTAPLTYQWRFNGNNISGATSSSLTISSVQTANAGSYTVVVGNPFASRFGSATSSGATLTVGVPPSIITQPASQIVALHSDPTFTVVATGTAPLFYQWQCDGTNIPGATRSGHPVGDVQASDQGGYSVLVSNAFGSVTSSVAMLFVVSTLVTWGDDTYGQLNMPPALSNATCIAAGDYHSTAVTDSGTVVQSGKYFDGALVSPPSYPNYVSTTAGLDHDIGLLDDGTVVTWGCPSAYAYNYVPANLGPAQAVACGWEHNVALLANGSVVAWGVNAYNATSVPSDLTTANAATAIAASYFHSLALRANGTVEAWGYNGDGECNVPAGLANVVAIAAGGAHCLALSSDGTVAAWGDNSAGQCNVPAGLNNVMAIAAGWAHSLALKNDGTLVVWGDNSSGQTTVPNVLSQVNIKMIAAGGDQSMAVIFTPPVQYPVDVSKDLLLIYNANSTDSWNVCQYYLTHRPMVSSCPNVLGIACPTNEIISQADFTNVFEPPILNWLAANPTKRPQYVILFQDFPSRIHNGIYAVSVQCAMNKINVSSYTPDITSIPVPGWTPFVTSINMNGTNGASDCTAYIDKLAHIGSTYSPGKLIISASAGGYGNTNWQFDGPAANGGADILAQEGVTNVDPNASVYGISSNYNQFLVTLATNVAGFYDAGWDSGRGDPTQFVDGYFHFFGQSGWYIMGTTDSYSGQRDDGGVPTDFVQAGFLTWFARTSLRGTNYSNTPVGGVTYVEEPSAGEVNNEVYYGDWAAGRTFAISAWDSQAQGLGVTKLQAVGDPFVKK